MSVPITALTADTSAAATTVKRSAESASGAVT